MVKTTDLPIVFMSYDEPWADEYWADLLSKAPHAKRVHGVLGLDACHKAALKAGGGEFVITVDADTIVRPSFMDVDISDEFLKRGCRVEYPSQNVINGQTYGNGSLKCWPGKMIREMRTHELSPKGKVSIDHAIGGHMSTTKASPRVHVPEVHSDVNPALTPYHAFRCGFREGVRLSLAGGGGLPFRVDLQNIRGRQLQRLEACCSVGTDCDNGYWLIYGTRLGVFMTHASDWDFTQINTYTWFETFWSDFISRRFGDGPAQCRYTGFRWDPAMLEAETITLGKRIYDSLNLKFFDLSPCESHLFRESGPEPLDWWMSDSFGFMYLKGLTLKANPKRARELFEIGALNEVAASVNNLARMSELGLDGPIDTEKALALFEQAVEGGDKFAPYHMANLLREIYPDDEFQLIRADSLTWLAAQRGFDPDDILSSLEAVE